MYIDTSQSIFPYTFEGMVVKGCGRGAKELNAPTANLEEDVVNEVSKALKNGIYYGKCTINDTTADAQEPMVMSLGFNPTYPGGKKTLEVHVINRQAVKSPITSIKAVVQGWLREEKKFDSSGTSFYIL